MHVLILGAAGMLGRKLTQRLSTEPLVFGQPVTRLTLADAFPSPVPDNLALQTTVLTLDLSEESSATTLVESRPDLIFHLAAIVSGEAEADFDKGYRVNLDGTRALFDAIRHRSARDAYKPRVIFASSLAVFGPPFPDVVDDDFVLAPTTSYGTQKAVDELLLADYSRRGFIDGIGLRLPTICVRPGAPNKAASGFFSSIIREPLKGQEAILPVDDSVQHWFASPRSAIGYFVHAAKLDTAQLTPRRNLTMPGLSVTVAEQIEALRRIAGSQAVSLIRRQPDETIARIVTGWPSRFVTKRALDLGFTTDRDFDDIIESHVNSKPR